MLRSLLRVSAAVGLALLASPGVPFALPSPGIAYDEIVRVVVSATPPPPGNFQADLAALNASAMATPTPAPQRHGMNFGNLAGAVLGGGGAGAIAGAAAGDAMSNAMDNAMEKQLGTQFAALGAAMRSFLEPHLFRYSFYNGWERVDDTTAQTATIRKCDIGQVVHLDIAKRTYSIYDPNSEPVPSPAPAPRSRNPAPAGTPAPPGTAVLTITSATSALGPLRIENQSTSGYDAKAGVAITQSTGSCRDGRAQVDTVDYYSGLNRPAVTSCPVRRPPVPQSADDVATPPQPTGGCRPTIAFQRSGPPVPGGKLSLYTLVTMNAAAGATPAPAPSGQPAGIGFLTERGNIKSLGAADAALFSIPADYTKVP